MKRKDFVLDCLSVSSSNRCSHPALPASKVFFFSPATGMSGSIGGPTNMCLHQRISADMSSRSKKAIRERELKQPPRFQQRPMEMGEQGQIRRKKSWECPCRICCTGFTSRGNIASNLWGKKKSFSKIWEKKTKKEESTIHDWLI